MHRAGSRPGGRVTSFAGAKEVTKKTPEHQPIWVGVTWFFSADVGAGFDQWPLAFGQRFRLVSSRHHLTLGVHFCVRHSREGGNDGDGWEVL
jgi:hypothetical protein